MAGAAEAAEFDLHLSQWLSWATGTLEVVSNLTKRLDGDVLSAVILILIYEQSLLASGATIKVGGLLIKPYSVRAIASRLGQPNQWRTQNYLS